MPGVGTDCVGDIPDVRERGRSHQADAVDWDTDAVHQFRRERNDIHVV